MGPLAVNHRPIFFDFFSGFFVPREVGRTANSDFGFGFTGTGHLVAGGRVED